MTKAEITKKYGPQANDGSAFTRKCRLLQSYYRVEELRQQEFGRHTASEKGTPVGSTLVNGESTGLNFLSDAARACAFEKLAEKAFINRDLTINRYRLFNNMLSSQPMCFNLFADLRLGIKNKCPDAFKVLSKMFTGIPMASIEQVEVEMLPQPKKNYTNDKSAFDAAILFSPCDGKRGLISIETKYTDKLGTKAASNEEKQKAIAREYKLFNSEGERYYKAHPFDQIIRNLLLTLKFAKVEGLEFAYNIVLAPKDDHKTREQIDELRKKLSTPFSESISLVTLEDVVTRGLSVTGGQYQKLLKAFHHRYLDFSRIQHLITSA